VTTGDAVPTSQRPAVEADLKTGAVLGQWMGWAPKSLTTKPSGRLPRDFPTTCWIPSNASPGVTYRVERNLSRVVGRIDDALQLVLLDDCHEWTALCHDEAPQGVILLSAPLN